MATSLPAREGKRCDVTSNESACRNLPAVGGRGGGGGVRGGEEPCMLSMYAAAVILQWQQKVK